jgi:hypothetical protein
MSVVSFGPSELAVSSEGDLLCAVDSRWPVVVVAGLATLSARVLAELPVDTVVVGRSGGVGWSGRDVLALPDTDSTRSRLCPPRHRRGCSSGTAPGSSASLMAAGF